MGRLKPAAPRIQRGDLTQSCLPSPMAEQLAAESTGTLASCKRNQPAVSATEAVFLATSGRQVELSWRQAHLLEIHYLRAQILEFTNLWSTALIRTRWLSTEEPYWIEIRLVPSSSDFSILNAGGGFQ
jgi:hypothetical protein